MARILGLDIGIASVGWGLIDTDEKRIVARGVRIFSRAEDPKTGASLALPRREARGTRRRLARRAERMADMKQLFLKEGLLTQEELDRLYVLNPTDKTPYELRALGLDRKLSNREWARVLSQLNKRRGYKSMRIGEGDDKDQGKVLQALNQNKQIMEEKGYRSAGEMLWKDEKFAQNKRNKGAYDNVLPRELLLEELELLFRKQKEFGNAHTSTKFYDAFLEIFMRQKGILEGEEILKMVGYCTFEPEEKRAPMASFSFEKFRFLQRANNIRWIDENGEQQAISKEQVLLLFEEALSRKTAINYYQIKNILGLSEGTRFTAVRLQKSDGEDISKAEKKEKLPELKFYHELEKVLSKRETQEYWNNLKNDEDTLNQLAHVFTYYKYENSVAKELEALGLPAYIVEVLSKSAINYSKVGSLSIKALKKITPFILEGKRYDEASLAAGYHHSQLAGGKKSHKLPPIPQDYVRNPVVLRSASQTRKIINAVIERYGALDEIHLELGRDMNKSAEERRSIERDQKENRSQADSRLEEIKDTLGVSNPRPHDLVKYRLFKEQNGECAYSGKPISRNRIFEPGYVEVDHILPYSRSFNNSLNNKVLVLTFENQKKGNRTPYEYKKHDSQEWKRFSEWVIASPLRFAKKRNLLIEDFDQREEEFRSRNLNDMRYVSRLMKSFIEENLSFGEDKKLRVVAVSGGVTAYLRNSWQLQKRREDHRHHALDALVVAAANSSMIQRVGTFFGARHLKNLPEEVRADFDYYDPKTGELIDKKYVPEPWEGFADQVRVWMSEDPLLAEMHNPDSMTFEERQAVKPLLVSQAPDRKVTGHAHMETIRRYDGVETKREIDEEGNITEITTGMYMSSKKIPLTSLKLTASGTNFENMLEKDTTNKALYEALVERLKEYGGNGEKAFAEPFYKPSRPGKAAPIVRSIRVADSPASGGVMVRGGISDNGAMVRVDVFCRLEGAQKKKRFYLVPVYVADVARGVLPNRAIVGKKAEADWVKIDENFEFLFSLHSGDYLMAEKKGGSRYEGYYITTNRSNGWVSFSPHDRQKDDGFGAKTLDEFKKYEVDLLGEFIAEVKKEKRRGFSNDSDT